MKSAEEDLFVAKVGGVGWGGGRRLVRVWWRCEVCGFCHLIWVCWEEGGGRGLLGLGRE